MSISTLDRPLTREHVLPAHANVSSVDVPMTHQKRVRFECFLIVGHAGVYFEYQCRSQAPFELEREGPKTIGVFADRVEQQLRSPAMMAELGDADLDEVVEAVRSKIFLLEREAPGVFDYRLGNVSLAGQTDTHAFHRL